MLVLSRKTNEAIVIQDAIRVTVIGIKGDRVRLGIEAPRDVTVDRAEVHQRRMTFVEVPVGPGAWDATVEFGEPLTAGADDTMH